MDTDENRSGRYVMQPTGYRAFVPAPLPPDPPITIDEELLALLSVADRATGRLDGSTEALPNPDLFVSMYVRKEAVLSSQIEGTQASLTDVLEFEANLSKSPTPSDAFEVVNYVRALNFGLDRLEEFPLSLRLITDIHRELMVGTRGAEMTRGEFRRSQNWIGPAGSTLSNARFVPPNPDDMKAALYDWEEFIYDERLPFLIHIGLVHAQFETIHPFLDGNGRLGRLLITFLLCERKVLMRPLLYLSHYLKKNRQEYYDRLQAIRDHGEWEPWLKFYLRGVATVANEATEVARLVVRMREETRTKIQNEFGAMTGDGLRLYDALFAQPYMDVNLAKTITGRSYPSANRLVKQMEAAAILVEISGRTRNRIYAHRPYLDIFEDQVE